MSTILSVDDLNDFIQPSVACIRPVEIERTSDSTVIEIGPDGNPLERQSDGSLTTLAKAQISLTDCLACSGCITSSEEFLMQRHSPTELLKALEDRSRIYVVSISHQSRVSLSQAFNMSIEAVDATLTTLFLEKLGFNYILGMEPGRAVALEAAVAELQSRSTDSGPILSSVCPGWTVYAEKTLPEIIPYLSRVKSPQQITGLLLKSLIATEQGIEQDRIFHLTLMPCFDKKLEASREQFSLPSGAKEVDMVITARELLLLVEDCFQSSFPQLGPASFTPPALAGWPSSDQWLSHEGSSSGGYLSYIANAAQMQNPGSTIEVLAGRNSDIEEVVVKKSSGEIVFRGAKVYGFRNIQNLVRKIKLKKSGVVGRAAKVHKLAGRVASSSTASLDIATLNYVEIMACPGGCVNGGGQIGPEAASETKSWIAKTEMLYQQMNKLTPEAVHQMAIEVYQHKPFGSNEQLSANYKSINPSQSNIPEALAVGSQW